MKLTKRENWFALKLAQGIVIVIAIFVYLLRSMFLALYKLKRYLFKFAIIVFLIYSSLNAFQSIALAPKSPILLDGYSYISHPKTEHEKIINYINLVFGKYSPRAFKLLTKCGENKELNPKAINDNTQWGGVGKDYGVFQLNNVYQRVGNSNFLLNYKINIDMAWVIFKDSGYNFHLWTGGKKCRI